MSLDWSARYQLGETPWEKGEPHPELPFLLSEFHDLITEARSIFVPGCGIGHDADLIHSQCKGEVLGLDLAKEAIDQAQAKYSGEKLSFVVGDLFEWKRSYDLVFEHTCFCAIPIERRSDYVSQMTELITTGGHLLGIFFLNPDHEGEEGPPFGVTVDELKDFFGDEFELVWSNPVSKTFKERLGEGRERSMLWRRL